MTMSWPELSAQQKTDAVRPLLEAQGMSYGQAAEVLQCSRVAIAGVVSRAKDRGQPIGNGFAARQIASKARRDNQIVARKAAAAKAKADKARLPRKPHQGFVKFVGLGGIGTTDTTPVKASAWDPIPGSTPVSLEHRTGCSWPVSADRPFIFCNLPVKDGRSWCEAHFTLGNRPVAVGTAVRRSAKPDRNSL